MTHPTDSKQDWQALQGALNELPSEIAPQRDLWPEVAQRIQQETSWKKDGNNIAKSQTWMPFAVAASLLIAVGAMFFSWHTWNQYALFSQQQMAQFERQSMLNLLENQHRLSKASFLQKLEGQSVDIDPAVVADLINNVMVIEQALQDIKSALILDPDNENLIALLKRTYEKQESLISQTRINYQTI